MEFAGHEMNSSVHMQGYMEFLGLSDKKEECREGGVQERAGSFLGSISYLPL